MLRFSLKVKRMDRIRNEVIRGTAQTQTWFEHVQRRGSGSSGKRMLEM